MLAKSPPRETVAQLFDDFYKLDTAATNGQWPTTTKGSSGTVNQYTTAGNAGGGWISILTAASANDYTMLSTPNVFEFLAKRPVWVEARLQITEAASNSSSWCFGLTDTVTTGLLQNSGIPATSYHGAMIYKPQGANAIAVQTSNGSAQVINAAAATFTSGSVLTVGFSFDPYDGTTGKVQFYINGTGTDAKFNKILFQRIALSGMTPMALALGVKASGAAVETLLVDYAGGQITR